MGKIRPSYGHGTGRPHPVDVHVGRRVRTRRTLLGMSQTALGQAIGLTFQQIQKYERGTNRIGSSRLFDLCKALDVPITFFFEDMPSAVAASSPAHGVGIAEESSHYKLDPIAKRESQELVRAYYKISNPNVRKRLFQLTKAFAAASVDMT